jgi:hypothetical protein
MVPAASVVLLVPFFAASWLIELRVNRRMLPEVDEQTLREATRDANLRSYLLLAGVAVGWLGGACYAWRLTRTGPDGVVNRRAAGQSDGVRPPFSEHHFDAYHFSLLRNRHSDVLQRARTGAFSRPNMLDSRQSSTSMASLLPEKSVLARRTSGFACGRRRIELNSTRIGRK